MMKEHIEFSEQEIKDLKDIRNYFGEHDKTQFEHLAFAVLDSLIGKLKPSETLQSKGKTKSAEDFLRNKSYPSGVSDADWEDFKHREKGVLFVPFVIKAMEEYAQSHANNNHSGKTKEELKDKFLKMFDDFHETYSKDEIFEWFWNQMKSHASKDGRLSCADKKADVINIDGEWIEFEGAPNLFTEMANKNCMCRFDDGTECRYMDEHPQAVMTHFQITP